MERLSTDDRANAELETVVANAAHVALAKVRTRGSDVTLSCLLRIAHRHRSRRLDGDGRRPSLGHERGTVQEANGGVDAFHRERSLERRGKAESDLDLVGVHERCEPPARVASVRGGERASKTVREHDLHRWQH